MGKRLFIALNTPPELSLFLENQISIVKNKDTTPLDSLRWIKKNDLHITLQFLGSQPEDNISSIDNLCKKIIVKYNRFALVSEYIALGPKKMYPTLLWMVFRDNGFFNNLVSDLATELIKIFPDIKQEKRKIIPHITLARLSKPVLLVNPFIQKIPQTVFKFGSLSLYESKLTPSESQYTRLSLYELN